MHVENNLKSNEVECRRAMCSDLRNHKKIMCKPMHYESNCLDLANSINLESKCVSFDDLQPISNPIHFPDHDLRDWILINSSMVLFNIAII
jgi:hypothetical protein